MFHKNMDISRLMVHAQKVYETIVKRKNREFKRANFFEGVTSKGRLEIQDKPRFKMTVYNEVPSKLSKANEDKVCNFKSQKGRRRN